MGGFLLALVTAGALVHVGVRMKGIEVAYALGKERKLNTELEERQKNKTDVDDHRTGDRSGDAAAEPLYDAGGDQEVDRRREGAPDGAQHADGTADEDRYAAPALI